MCSQCRQFWRYWVPVVSPPTLFSLLRPLWRVLGGGGALIRGSLCGRLGGLWGLVEPILPKKREGLLGALPLIYCAFFNSRISRL